RGRPEKRISAAMVDIIDKANEVRQPANKPSWLSDAKRRLVATRYVLAGSAVLFCGLAVFDRIPWLLALELSAAMAVIAVISPTRTARARKREKTERLPSHDYTVANALLDALKEPLVLLDGRGTIQFASKSAMTRVGKISIGSSSLLRFRTPELQEMIQEVMAGGSPDPVELRERGQHERYFEVSAFRLPDDVGPRYRVCLHFADSTEAHSMERMRSDFVANASHELRTPLASLTGYIETLAGPAKNDKEAQARFLPIMLEQTDRMARLVNDLLHLSKYETARGVEDYAPVDVQDVLTHVANAVKPLGDSQNTTVELHRPDGVDGVMVNGDREELIKLFENLIENAIKYGGENKSVNIKTEHAMWDGKPAWKVSVIDQGPGIEEQHLPRLTERFYRVDVEKSRGKQGTGLGLAIVKHVATRHSGKLQVESEPGSGSNFFVLIPRLSSED
ncbi:MAG: ATP-binding protein, partial [Pseudomonadota bacterium]